jgi:RNA polymerase sigma factor (sigma-70 family)
MATYAHVTDTTADDHCILLHRLSTGDAAAFWELWEHYKPTLSRHCLQWMGGNHADAEDALSGASLRAWQYVCTHTVEITNVKAWLFRVLYNHCMSLKRSHQGYVRHTQQLQDVYRLKTAPSTSVDGSFENTILRREMQMYMRSRIDALPPRLREPVILYFFQDMRHREIASHLNLTTANVRKRLQHARNLLRTQMTPYFQEEKMVVWQKARPDTTSPTPEASMREPASLLTPTREDRSSRVVAMRPVRVDLPNGIERYVHLALEAMPARQQQKLATLHAYLQRHPTGWRKRLQLAELLYTMGSWKEATDAYRLVLRQQPHDLDIRLRLGQMLHLLQRDNEALTLYQNALTLPQKEATQRHVEGCIATCRQDMGAAVQAFTAATALEPCNVLHWHALGLAHVQTDRTAEALHAFDQALRVDANDLVALTHSYSPLVMAGRYLEAQQRMEQALGLDSGHTTALTRLVANRCRMRWIYGDKGAQTKALLRRATKTASECPEVQAVRAHYHIAQGKWNTGLAVLREYTSKHPSCPEGWYHYARWCLRAGAPENAATAIMHAYALSPNDIAICQTACDILSAAGRYDKARRLLEAMLQHSSNSWDVCATAARLLIDVFHDQEGACTVSARCPALQPTLAQAWFQHGRVLMLAGRHRKAITAFEQGWSRLPDVTGDAFATPAALWLSASYRIVGQEAKSQSWWRQAVQCSRDFIGLHPAMGRYWLGQALASLGHWDGVRQAYCPDLQHPGASSCGPRTV